MVKREILQELKKLDDLGLPKTSYTIVYGAALVLHGIKDNTSDIDMNGSPAAFKILAEKGYKLEDYPKRPGTKYIKLTEYIDIFDPKTMSSKVLTQMVNGYKVQTPGSILMEKKKRGRPKDLQDVKIIEDWMKGK